ncbi:tRNA-uridine aminocarboxypropyltransferase [Oxalobacteraceae bacterium R-40]|uniref:tRNA-uridine aminocarboxypropyltransferase n=1 Tax=Keguizhuia sedimenti TaxID=3064264 RepID=A0ABU1BM63_9BURK|nr:tRNA-uridine aminocarboxypropyltransferase [Oxalobacteraceae bacterium R-40]
MTPIADMQTAGKRAICSCCLRPHRTCICRVAVPIRHATEVLILQHPLEVHQAKGTARLLHLCLPKSRIITGEQFNAKTLHSLLYDPWQREPDETQGSMSAIPVLLYPDTGHNAPEKAEKTTEALSIGKHAERCRLIVLDGTWRKSRKMLHLNPMLATLPRLSLSDAAPSRYQIRKAHRPGQLSTLEACCYVLMQMECNPEGCQPLLSAFAKFIEMQQCFTHAAAADTCNTSE